MNIDIQHYITDNKTRQISDKRKNRAKKDAVNIEGNKSIIMLRDLLLFVQYWLFEQYVKLHFQLISFEMSGDETRHHTNRTYHSQQLTNNKKNNKNNEQRSQTRQGRAAEKAILLLPRPEGEWLCHVGNEAVCVNVCIRGLEEEGDDDDDDDDEVHDDDVEVDVKGLALGSWNER